MENSGKYEQKCLSPRAFFAINCIFDHGNEFFSKYGNILL